MQTATFNVVRTIVNYAKPLEKKARPRQMNLKRSFVLTKVKRDGNAVRE
jgi:hypothetical protein